MDRLPSEERLGPKPEIKSLSHRHEAIGEWLLANPEKKLQECAAQFGVTQAWLSTIIHSDIFKLYYQDLLGDYHDERIIPLRDKMNGIAHQGADRLSEKIATIDDPSVLLNIVDRIGKRLEPARPQAGVTVNLYPAVPTELIKAARLKLLGSAEIQQSPVPKLLEESPEPLSE